MAGLQRSVDGFFTGLINWETQTPMFLHGLGPLLALEMRQAENASSLYEECHSGLQKEVYFVFCSPILKPEGWLPS